MAKNNTIIAIYNSVSTNAIFDNGGKRAITIAITDNGDNNAIIIIDNSVSTIVTIDNDNTSVSIIAIIDNDDSNNDSANIDKSVSIFAIKAY